MALCKIRKLFLTFDCWLRSRVFNCCCSQRQRLKGVCFRTLRPNEYCARCNGCARFMRKVRRWFFTNQPFSWSGQRCRACMTPGVLTEECRFIEWKWPVCTFSSREWSFRSSSCLWQQSWLNLSCLSGHFLNSKRWCNFAPGHCIS